MMDREKMGWRLRGMAAGLQDMGNGVTVEELIRTVEDISRSCH